MVVLGLVSAGGARAEIIWQRGSEGVVRAADGVIRYFTEGSRWAPVAGGTAGGAVLSSSRSLVLAGAQPVTITGTRLLSQAAIVTAARGAAKLLGPVGVLASLAPLFWDEVQDLWLAPGEADPYEDVGKGSSGLYYGSCEYQAPVGTIRRYTFGSTSYENLVWVSSDSPLPGGRAAWPTALNNCECKNYPNLGCPEPKWGVIYRRAVSGSCPAGESRTYEGTCAAPEPVPASDEQIEEAILQSMPYPDAAPLVGHLKDLPYDIPGAGAETITGPGTVNGGTTTSTTTGPAGQTTVNNTTQYNINYNGDTATVTQVTTSTTTYPDNSTSTTTTTATSEGSVPTGEEPPVDVCVEHPEASGCQPLGSVDTVDVGVQAHTLTWTAEGSAAGSCPAPMSFSLPFGGTGELSWAPVCQFATGIRPVIIAIAWLSAGIFIFQVARG